MKPLKFRAWHYTEKKISIVHTISPEKVMIIDNDHHREYQREDLELLQFTGLVDYYGKEIYEGDLVKYIIGFSKDGPQAELGGIEEVKQVSFLKGSFVAQNIEEEMIWHYISNLINNISKLHVIGNRFENMSLAELTSH